MYTVVIVPLAEKRGLYSASVNGSHGTKQKDTDAILRQLAKNSTSDNIGYCREKKTVFTVRNSTQSTNTRGTYTADTVVTCPNTDPDQSDVCVCVCVCVCVRVKV